MDDKSRSILTQVSFKVAATLYTGSGNVDGMIGAAERIMDALFAYHDTDKVLAAAESNVRAGLGSITPIGPAAQAPQAPAPLTPQGGGGKAAHNEALWQDVFNNPSGWYDNRTEAEASLNGGSRPDFKRKDDGEALWIRSKFKDAQPPAWVLERLGLN